VIPPGGSLNPRALPPAGQAGALAHPVATGGALATEAPPVWAHPIPEEDAHFWDYWRVLVRHRWTVITFFLLAVVVGTVWTFTTRPLFTSVATLRIDKEEPRVLKFEQVVPAEQADYQQTQYQTQLKILQSRALASRVIGLLTLDQHPEFQSLDAEAGWLAGAKAWVREQLVHWIPVPPPPAPEASEDLALESPLTRAFAERLAVDPVRNARLGPVVDPEIELEDVRQDRRGEARVRTLERSGSSRHVRSGHLGPLVGQRLRLGIEAPRSVQGHGREHGGVLIGP